MKFKRNNKLRNYGVVGTSVKLCKPTSNSLTRHNFRSLDKFRLPEVKKIYVIWGFSELLQLQIYAAILPFPFHQNTLSLQLNEICRIIILKHFRNNPTNVNMLAIFISKSNFIWYSRFGCRICSTSRLL